MSHPSWIAASDLWCGHVSEIKQEDLRRWCEGPQGLTVEGTLVCVVFTWKIQPEPQSRLNKHTHTHTRVQISQSIYPWNEYLHLLLLEHIDL